MLSGEGNAGEWWKTTIGVISKKTNFARAAHFFCTFLCRCFTRLPRETSRNFLVTRFIVFMEEMSYVFSFTFFSLPVFFYLALVAASISHFVTAATKFSSCFSNKKNVSSVFISRSKPLWPFSSLSFTGLPPTFFFFSVFLLLHIPNLWTWQLV